MEYKDLSMKSKTKIMKTVDYSMSKNPSQDYEHVISRCTIAIMAEQRVASHLDGEVADYDANMADPYSYAYDVIGSKEYYHARVEVKTHQSDAKWITVNTEHNNISGAMNIFHFINYDIADYITIYKTGIKSRVTSFQLAFMGDRNDLKSVIKKSNYSGWYLNI